MQTNFLMQKAKNVKKFSLRGMNSKKNAIFKTKRAGLNTEGHTVG